MNSKYTIATAAKLTEQEVRRQWHLCHYATMFSGKRISRDPFWKPVPATAERATDQDQAE